MQKSIQIAYNELFEKKCEYAAAAGFRHISVNFTEIEAKTEYEWDVHTENIQRILDKTGIRCVQSHPYYYDLRISSEIMEEEHEFAIRQAIRASGKLGAAWCALHPRSSVSTGFRSTAALEDNRRAFSDYLEYAVKYGTGLAAENLPIFCGIRPAMPFYSSNYEDLCQLVDSFADEHVKVCWDFGHAHLMHFDQADAIRYMGDRIRCTHVHNNFRNDDSHLTPDSGSIDWPRVMAALASTGYDGALTLETHCCYTEDGLLASFARHNFGCLEYLERLFLA